MEIKTDELDDSGDDPSLGGLHSCWEGEQSRALARLRSADPLASGPRLAEPVQARAPYGCYLD